MPANVDAPLSNDSSDQINDAKLLYQGGAAPGLIAAGVGVGVAPKRPVTAFE